MTTKIRMTAEEWARFDEINGKVKKQIAYQRGTGRGGTWTVTLKADDAEWLVDKFYAHGTGLVTRPEPRGAKEGTG